MSSVAMSIKNNDGAVRHICDIIPSPKINGFPDKICITDYTRDAGILTSASIKSKFRFMAAKESDLLKLKDFAEYLRGRKKAGKIHVKLGSGEIDIYLLPPNPNREIRSHGLSCVCTVSIPGVDVGPGTSSSSVYVKPKVDVKKSSSVSTPSSVDAAPQVRIDAVDPVESQRQEIMRIIRALEKRCREDLLRFDEDPNLTHITYEPMEKDKRFIIHDVCEDYENLVSVSEGHEDDRHIVVYRKGFEPEEELQVDKGSLIAALTTGKRVVSKQEKEALRNSGGAMQSINQVKRDRRTIEEIQNDLKRAKQ